MSRSSGFTAGFMVVAVSYLARCHIGLQFGWSSVAVFCYDFVYYFCSLPDTRVLEWLTLMRGLLGCTICIFLYYACHPTARFALLPLRTEQYCCLAAQLCHQFLGKTCVFVCCAIL
jgi:hypothetical protein